MHRLGLKTWLIAAVIGLLWTVGAFAQGMFGDKPAKLPAKIVFIRDKNIWIRAADGSGEKEWATLGNVAGRLAWHPDGKRVAFARKGDYNYSLPDGGGGKHPLYDIFAKHIDSAGINAWWWVTFNHGSHSPDWSRDGQYILYTHDINANQVDSEKPDYQIEWRTFDGKEVHSLTRKGAAPRESQGIQPSFSPDRSKVAFVYLKDMKPVGLVIEPATGVVRSEAELEKAAKVIPDIMFPQWSPDGKWIACVNNEDSDNGIYLVSPDAMTKKRIFAKIAPDSLKGSPGLIPHRAPVSWSADSKWLAFSSNDGYVYVMDVEGKNVTKVTSGGNDYYPAFCPK